MGACCSTEEDVQNINIDHKSGQNKKPKKGSKCSPSSSAENLLSSAF